MTASTSPVVLLIPGFFGCSTYEYNKISFFDRLNTSAIDLLERAHT